MNQRGNINSYKTNVILYYYHCAYRRFESVTLAVLHNGIVACLGFQQTCLKQSAKINTETDWIYLQTPTYSKDKYKIYLATLQFNADDSYMQAKICKARLFSPFPSVFSLSDELN